MAIKSFRRYEKKYLITEKQYNLLIPKLLEHMEEDKFCKDGNNYCIYNIYYDTVNNDVIRHSISKPYYKEKLRLRSYNVPSKDDDIVFLELKKKINGIVNKRRVVLTLKEAHDLLEHGKKPVSTDYMKNQLLDEIDYYLSNNDVVPKVYIGYTRKAFFDKIDKDFRLTFDSKILTRRNSLSLEDGYFGSDILKENTFLMEVKILAAMPLWFSNILSELCIYSTHFSKYGNEFMDYILKEKSDNNLNRNIS